MVRRYTRPNRNYLTPPNSHGLVSISLDSNPYLVPRSHVSSRLRESWCADAPSRDRISAGDQADSDLLDDSGPIFNRRLPARAFRSSLRSSGTSGRSSESDRERMGSLQAYRGERLEDVQDLQPLSLSALSRDDSGCGVKGLGQQSHKPSHTPRNLAHYHIRYPLRAHHPQHHIKEKSVGHDPV